jgi:hypothetical protein
LPLRSSDYPRAKLRPFRRIREDLSEFAEVFIEHQYDKNSKPEIRSDGTAPVHGVRLARELAPQHEPAQAGVRIVPRVREDRDRPDGEAGHIQRPDLFVGEDPERLAGAIRKYAQALADRHARPGGAS